MSQKIPILAGEPEGYQSDGPSGSEESAVFRGRGRQRHTILLRDAAVLFLETLREIFDESAYTRFLRRSGMVASRQAYAVFLRENELAKARRPRCC